MEDTTISIIGLLIASVMFFLVPLILIADRSDDISQLIAQTATTEFVDTVIKSGKITMYDYQNFVTALSSSGNTYQIDMEVKILDETPSKIHTDINGKIGKNAYYSLFTTQIEQKLEESIQYKNHDDILGVFALKQGDIVYVSVRNDNATFSQALKRLYYSAEGSDIHIISATASGTVVIDGITSSAPTYFYSN